VRGRFVLIDSMRALAALSVVYYHVAFRFPPPPPSGAHSLASYLNQRTAGPPITAVVLFFLISGFVLYRPFVAARFAGERPPPLVPYAVRRFARIVPGYWVTLAIVSAWLGYGYMLHLSGFVRYFGFLQLYGSVHTLDGGISVAWTLCVEVSFYIALPLLALIARRIGRRRSVLSSELALLAGMVVTSLVWQLVVTAQEPASSRGALSLLSMLPGSLDLFAAGMLLAVLSVEQEHRVTQRRFIGLVDRAPWLPWLAAFAVLYAEGRVPGSAGLAAWWITTHALKMVACALLLLPVVFGQGGLLRRVLGAAPLIWLGTVSYGIYLWHWPVLQKLAPQLTPHGEPYTLAIVTVLSVGLGAATYYLVERPSQRLARRWITRHAPAPEAPAPAPAPAPAAPAIL
jgi:peptidoglycan/LPS O-acetylase OafA/YrhL